jgi:uncharacterized protein (DUF697 family)
MSSDIREEANKNIKEHVLYSMGAGLIPIFFLDIAAITAIQMDMIRRLCRLYEIDYEETKGKAVATALTGTTLGRLAGYGIGSALKIIPGIGTLLGGVTLSLTAGATTYALGQVFAQHFERGGSLFDLDPDEFRRFYRDQVERGKDIAKRWKDEKEQSEPEKTQEKKEHPILTELRAAEQLKNSGALTEEEFNSIKEDLLQRYMKHLRDEET